MSSTSSSGGSPPSETPRSIEPRDATIRTPSSRAACTSASTSPVRPLREDVVVVEHGRAARQRELREPGARRRVLRLRVDSRPHRVELAQPAEEVGLLRAGSREGLVQVVVRVDEAGSDERSREVDALVGSGSVPAPTDDDLAAVDEEPAGLVLGSLVVAGRDPAAGVERRHTASGTSSKRSTSTRPRSVIFRCGMTDSARNASVRNGVAPDQPSSCAASLHARLCAITSASGASERSPATGSGHSARTRPDSSPRRSRRRARRAARSRRPCRRSDMPTTTRLCASCATLDASAPRRRPEPVTNPSPTRPGREVPLDDRDLREVALRVRDGVAVDDRGLPLDGLGHDLILHEADRPQRCLRSTGPRGRRTRAARREPTAAPSPGSRPAARPRSGGRASAPSTAGS